MAAELVPVKGMSNQTKGIIAGVLLLVFLFFGYNWYKGNKKTETPVLKVGPVAPTGPTVIIGKDVDAKTLALLFTDDWAEKVDAAGYITLDLQPASESIKAMMADIKANTEWYGKIVESAMANNRVADDTKAKDIELRIAAFQFLVAGKRLQRTVNTLGA
jgi:hypothetical protein